MSSDRDSNPFSTRCVRPGAIEYRFEGDDCPALLVMRLGLHEWRGQIIGPHGTGKSTLLRTLAPEIERTGRKVEFVTLSQGQRWWRPSADQVNAWNSRTLVVIDGYEQLNVWARWRLRSICRRRGAGLLITAHKDMGFPTLFQSAVTLERAQTIVADLQRDGDTLVTADDVAAALEVRGGNLREALFDLYDLYELRRPRSPS